MKSLKLLISILSFLIFSQLAAQTLKTVEANPINVAVSLMQRLDTASMSKTLTYYGYIRQTPPSGIHGASFTHPNGSTISYKFTDHTQSFPTVEVISKVSAKEKVQILKNLKFEKVGNLYEQKSIGYTTLCNFGPSGTLILTRISKP